MDVRGIGAIGIAALVGVQPRPGIVEGVVSLQGVRVADAVIYLVPAAPAAPPPAGTALIDQVSLRFVPHVLAVTAGTMVEFRNSDPILHNVFSPPRIGDAFDLGTYPQTDRRAHTFTAPGVYVVLCHVHPEMLAYVVVVPTPHHAVADRDGHFRLDGVPPGNYRLHVWHRRLGTYDLPVTVPDDGHRRLLLDLAALPRSRP